MLTVLWLLLSLLAALGFYLSSAHQRLWLRARGHARTLRGGGWLATVLALAAAIVWRGTWAGAFAVLTSLMLALVLLPYLDAARQLRKGKAA